MEWMDQLWPEWHIECPLGAGAYGNVYKIRREDLGGTYYAALKVISFPRQPGELDVLRSKNLTDEQIRSYYRRTMQAISSEIAVMERFKGNTNIVSYEDHKIVEHVNDPGWDILIRMELLTSMQDYLKTHPINEKDVCRIGIDICKALILCEKQKLIHRDIKPGNIFVSGFGSFKLGDFGLAKHFTMFEDNAVPQGTVHYMAPEVYKATGYDYSIDTYALGLILYRLMNRGREPFLPLPPHKVTREMYREANNRRLGAEPFPAPADASPEMAEIILRACAYDPADRFRSAEDMRRALAGCEKKHPAESSAKRIIDLIRKAVNDVFAEPETLEPPMRRDLPDISSGSVISAVPDFIEMSVTDDMSSPMDAFFSAPGDL